MQNNMQTKTGEITLSNIKSYNYTNWGKTHKGFTMLGVIEGLEGTHEVIACEKYTEGCEKLVEGVKLNTRLAFNSLKTSNSVLIEEVY